MIFYVHRRRAESVGTRLNCLGEGFEPVHGAIHGDSLDRRAVSGDIERVRFVLAQHGIRIGGAARVTHMKRGLRIFHRLARCNEDAGLPGDAVDKSGEGDVEPRIPRHGKLAVDGKRARRGFDFYRQRHQRRGIGKQSGRGDQAGEQQAHFL